jgi:hypothetical protein
VSCFLGAWEGSGWTWRAFAREYVGERLKEIGKFGVAVLLQGFATL